MLLLEDGLSVESSKDKLKKFDETLRSLRRQFRKLLKETNIPKSCKQLINLSEEDSSITSKKTIDSSEGPQEVKELSSEDKKVLNDITMTEYDNNMKNLSTNDLDISKVDEENIPQDDILEILSVNFDTESEQSLLQQFEQSKLNSSCNNDQLQKSPVLYRNRIIARKSQSPKVNLISCKNPLNAEKERIEIIKKEQVIETKNSAHESISFNVNKSLFSSVKEKEVFTSPKSKPCQKLGVSTIYNVSAKMSSKGNKLKQTKLVFVADEEKTDISKMINFNNEAENSSLDSIFDSTLFNSNINLELMDVDMEDTFSIAKSTTDTRSLSSTPKKPRTLNKDGFEKISPTKENKKIKSKNEVKIKKNKVDKSQTISSNLDLNAFKPQACSTQILSTKKQDTTSAKITHSNSDSDTDFSFYEDRFIRNQQSPNIKRKIAGVMKKASPLKDNSDKDDNQVSQVQVTETMMDDETFFSPGEYKNDTCLKTHKKPSVSGETLAVPKIKRVLMSSFDQISEKKKRSPDYAYAVQSVRRKCERAQLTGWACWDCKKYYQNLNLPEKELKECLKKCSRHKAKYDPEYHTPPDFWNPAFPDTFAPTLDELENK